MSSPDPKPESGIAGAMAEHAEVALQNNPEGGDDTLMHSDDHVGMDQQQQVAGPDKKTPTT